MFSRALGQQHVITSSMDWHTVMFMAFRRHTDCVQTLESGYEIDNPSAGLKTLLFFHCRVQ